MIERIFGGKEEDNTRESTGKCPNCGKLDGLTSELKEVDGKLVFQSSECKCGYEA